MYALRRMLWWYAPVFVVLAGTYAYTAATPYTVVLHPDTFYALVAAPALIAALINVPRLFLSRNSYGPAKEDALQEDGPRRAASPVSGELVKELKRARAAFTAVAAYAATGAVTGFIIFLITAGVLL